MPNYDVHESAYIDHPAYIGEGTKIWHFCHICNDAYIGPRCTIGQGVYIGPKVSIGPGCKIQNNVSIYEGVIIGSDVFIGPHTTFTNVLRPRANISQKDSFLRTYVANGATIGAGCVILPGITIGEGAFVAAGCTVSRDVPPHTQIRTNRAMTAKYLKE